MLCSVSKWSGTTQLAQHMHIAQPARVPTFSRSIFAMSVSVSGLVAFTLELREKKQLNIIVAL